ncbi:sialate O-acetylesterase [Occallatibacter riparius]|uniref:Sialate O-acetylesterase n=1 Tax=Occallatibacter riparius TaxID=1002689 RepID=A0A9J7BIJ7_9BACT|nr:sialate O-acetylesterase [Occallatibacter riparius]UWZ82511.1 sialate O-acetylesterase [Occallatibacter riparius]
MKLRLLALLALLPLSASAQVILPKVLSDHMVVQRDLPVHVWGMAQPGEQVTVSFRGEAKSTTSTNIGRWSLYLKPGAAGGPFEMTVVANGLSQVKSPAITLRDILVGDVWIASGQSNMQFALDHASTAATDLPKADNPKIRLLIVDDKASDYPQEDIPTTGWAASSPVSAKQFSAVAWYFAREIEQREHVPVGVIDSSWGGTPAEAWTRLTALGQDAQLSSLITLRGKMIDDANDTALHVKDEQRQRDEAKAAGKPEPQFPWHPAPESFGLGYLWNAMIAPLTPFPIRGAIWYQGEANAGSDRFPTYDRVMRDMIEDWRRQWGIGPFPFYYVQLANWITGPDSNWADVRDQQRRTLGERNTAMAVAIDVGNPNDIHPTDKATVGHRLAIAARALNYGERELEYSGPMFRQATPEGSSIRAWFDHAKGLTAKGGAEVTSVEIAGPDGKYFQAKATIDGETIVASSPDVPTPVSIRYGWASNPQCNLYNSDGLPASPFTSEKQGPE